MMRAGHIAGTSPFALTVAWVLPAPTGVRLGCAAVTMLVCTAPDWDHPRFQGRVHPGAALVRWSARLLYLLRTDRDREREDVHRGPAHCAEYALLVGLVFALLALRVPLLAPWAWWIGVSAAVGWFSHILVDAMTPSGVPVSAVYNLMRYGEVWKRHAFTWRRLGGSVWLRFPLLTPVDQRREHRPGLFVTDSGAEHLIVVPLMWIGTGVLALAMVGVLGPVLAALTGWS